MKSIVELHIAGTPAGKMPVSALRPSDVQAWATSISRKLAPSTSRLVVNTLRAVLNAAVNDGLIASSPARRVSLPRSESGRIVPLTVSQVQALADTVAPQYRAAVIAQAGLGLRAGELLALRVSEIDFLRRSVRVEWQIEAASGRRVEPKTPRSVRSLPMPQVVGDELARHIERFHPSPGARLFPMTPVSHSAAIRKAAAAAGLPPTTSHALRHHYASVLLAAGESVVAVAERLGHDQRDVGDQDLRAPVARLRRAHPDGR